MLSQVILGTTYIDEFRQKTDLVQKVSPPELLDIYQYVWLALVMLNLFLCIICKVVRPIARCFYPIEMVKFIILNSLPVDETCGGYEKYVNFFFAILMAILFICDAKIGLCTLILATAASNIGLYVATGEIMLSYLIQILLLVTIAAIIIIFTAVINYVSSLRTKLRMQVIEYQNLLNRMREGIIVFFKLNNEFQI